MKKKILAIMQLPPPVHGASTMNKIIHESRTIRSQYDLKTINLQFAEIGNIGKFSFYKIFKMIHYYIFLFLSLFYYKPDLVYFTLSISGYAFYRDCFYILLIKILNFPIVYHLHGKGLKEKLSNPFQKFLYRFVFRDTKVILLSNLLYPDISDVCHRSQIYYLPNGIDENSLCQNRCESDSVEGEDVKILFLSNLAKTKGVLDLIDASALLFQKGEKFQVYLAGSEHSSLNVKLLLSRIDKKGAGNIHLLGPIYGDDKKELMEKSDIFVFPTYFEAFPLVILEAMRAGLPVISTYEGAIPEIVEDGVTGHLVKQRDIAALAEKIFFLVCHKETRHVMGKKGKNKFLFNYTKNIFENNILKIFDDILDASRT